LQPGFDRLPDDANVSGRTWWVDREDGVEDEKFTEAILPET
jgi:hypothetical protein